MAKVVTQVIQIELSQLVKDSTAEVANMVTEDLLTNLEVVAQELAGSGVIVEAKEIN
jgi:hypothetical protein